MVEMARLAWAATALSLLVLTPAGASDAGRPSSAQAGRRAIVAADELGRILSLDEEGAIRRVLVDEERTGGPVGGIATGATGTIWFARHDPLVGLPCDSSLHEAEPSTDRPPRHVGTGFAPAFSPDGDAVAYVATTSHGESCRFEVAVRQPGSSDVRRWPLTDGWEQAYGICSVAWLGVDRLAVELCVENDVVVHVLDLARDEAVGDDTFVGPGDPDRSWTTPARANHDRHLLVSEVPATFEPASRPPVVQVRDASDGSLLRRLFTAGGDVTSIDGLDVSDTGRGVLFVAFVDDGGSTVSRLFRWEGEGRPVAVRDGIVAAMW
jgi:hypothetical protein